MNSKKILEVMEEVLTGDVVLPLFQRSYEWKDEQVEGLLKSLFSKLPIGSWLFLKAGDLPYKELGMYNDTNSEKGKVYNYLLDGQQRLTSLCVSLSGIINLRNSLSFNKKNSISKKQSVRKKWFLNIEHELFGYDNFKFDIKKESPFLPSNIDIGGQMFVSRTCSDGDILSFSNLENSKVDDVVKKCTESGEALLPLATLFAASIGTDTYFNECLSDNKKTKSNLRFLKRVFENIIKSITISNVLNLMDERENDSNKWKSFLDTHSEDYSELNDDCEDIVKKVVEEIANTWSMALNDYLKSILEVQVTITSTDFDTIDRAIAQFEHLNIGGMKLSVFDILVARVANKFQNPTLRDYILNILTDNATKNMGNKDVDMSDLDLENLKKVPKLIYKNDLKKWIFKNYFKVNNNSLPSTLTNTFLNVIIALSSTEDNNSVYKENSYLKQLNDPDKIVENSGLSLEGVFRAIKFFQYRLAIRDVMNINYKLMLTVVSYAFTDNEIYADEKCLCRLEAWYYISLFGGRYRTDQNKSCEIDIKNIKDYARGVKDFEDKYYEEEILKYKNSVLDVAGYSDCKTLTGKDDNIRVNKGIIEGLNSFIISGMSKDFRNNDIILDDYWNIKIKKCFHKHHIIPLGSLKRMFVNLEIDRKDESKLWNYPLQLLSIASVDNLEISDNKFDEYVNKIDKKIKSECYIDIVKPIEFDSTTDVYTFNFVNENNSIHKLHYNSRELRDNTKIENEKILADLLINIAENRYREIKLTLDKKIENYLI